MELNELPGSELILPGLEDLYHGRNDTIGSLLISIASIRLTSAGLDIPHVPLVPEPELLLYKHYGLMLGHCLKALSTQSRNSSNSPQRCFIQFLSTDHHRSILLRSGE